MTDPAEIRAGMRRKLEAWHRGVDVGLVDYLTRHADVLLADPAPEPAEALTRVRTLMDAALEWTDSGGECADFITAALATLTTLADPAPVGLTEDERATLGWLQAMAPQCHHTAPVNDCANCAADALIDRLSAAPIDDRERVPEGWRAEWRRHLIPETSMFVSGRTSQYEDRPYLVPVSPSVDPIELAEECVCRSDGYDHGLYSAECPAHVAARHSVDPEGGVMDPAELAEGRKLLAEAREIGWPPDLPRSEALNKWLVRHADALLASVDPEER